MKNVSFSSYEDTIARLAEAIASSPEIYRLKKCSSSTPTTHQSRDHHNACRSTTDRHRILTYPPQKIGKRTVRQGYIRHKIRLIYCLPIDCNAQRAQSIPGRYRRIDCIVFRQRKLRINHCILRQIHHNIRHVLQNNFRTVERIQHLHAADFLSRAQKRLLFIMVLKEPGACLRCGQNLPGSGQPAASIRSFHLQSQPHPDRRKMHCPRPY